MSEIGRFVTEFVGPAAKVAGFVRQQHSYRRGDPLGNIAALSVRPALLNRNSGPGAARMDVGASFCMPLAAEFTEEVVRDERDVERAGKVWHLPLESPPGLNGRPRADHMYWIFTNPAERLSAGQALTDHLTKNVFPLLVRLLDPAFRETYLFSDEGRRNATWSPLVTEMLFGLEAGASAAQIEAWLVAAREIEAWSVVAFLQRRLPSA